MEAQQNDVAENQTVPVLVLTDAGIQRVAFWLRVLGGCNKHTQFDPIYVMECVIAAQDETFNYFIIEKSDWFYGTSCQALYKPVENTIYIRSDVYDAALEGKGQALITIAHEICHYIQNLLLPDGLQVLASLFFPFVNRRAFSFGCLHFNLSPFIVWFSTRIILQLTPFSLIHLKCT